MVLSQCLLSRYKGKGEIRAETSMCDLKVLYHYALFNLISCIVLLYLSSMLFFFLFSCIYNISNFIVLLLFFSQVPGTCIYTSYLIYLGSFFFLLYFPSIRFSLLFQYNRFFRFTAFYLFIYLKYQEHCMNALYLMYLGYFLQYFPSMQIFSCTFNIPNFTVLPRFLNTRNTVPTLSVKYIQLYFYCIFLQCIFFSCTSSISSSTVLPRFLSTRNILFIVATGFMVPSHVGGFSSLFQHYSSQYRFFYFFIICHIFLWCF